MVTDVVIDIEKMLTDMSDRKKLVLDLEKKVAAQRKELADLKDEFADLKDELAAHGDMMPPKELADHHKKFELFRSHFDESEDRLKDLAQRLRCHLLATNNPG